LKINKLTQRNAPGDTSDIINLLITSKIIIRNHNTKKEGSKEPSIQYQTCGVGNPPYR